MLFLGVPIFKHNHEGSPVSVCRQVRHSIPGNFWVQHLLIVEVDLSKN